MSGMKRHLVVFLFVPVVLVAAAFIVAHLPYSIYTRGTYGVLAALLVADLTIGLRGKWRDGALVVCITIFGLAGIELGSAAFELRSPVIDSKGFMAQDPELGWSTPAPGVYHSERIAPDGKLIYAADYTIDDHLLRKTVSAASGPTVAFFGDSFTFGLGLPDSGTLPQYFADLTERKTRVLNFAVPAYGPQQFLRALEIGRFDPLLKDAQVFIYLTAPWHAQRSSCLLSFMGSAPRYELYNGKLELRGRCVEGLGKVVQAVFNGAAFRRFVQPAIERLHAGDIELYMAEIRRCAELVRDKYHARMIVLYLSEGAGYLDQTGFTDETIKEKLRQAGVELVDASLSPADFPPGTKLNIPGDGHPTAIANRARAELLHKYLADLSAATVTAPKAE
mgnify:CR=1 FL=1